MNNNQTACLIIIGNEILSGRTQDRNLNYIATQLNDMGINFLEVRVIADIEEDIIQAVNQLRHKYNYVFTTGGIGPTHDDITTSCIAKALGKEIVRDKHVTAKLSKYYEGRNDQLNEARLKMADFPQGAELLENPVSIAPGYKIENIFVMAGIPKIMQEMFNSATGFLQSGIKVISREIAAFVSESQIAQPLSQIQDKYGDVEIGSYPFSKDNKYGANIVLRSQDQIILAQAYDETYNMLENHGQIID